MRFSRFGWTVATRLWVLAVLALALGARLRASQEHPPGNESAVGGDKVVADVLRIPDVFHVVGFSGLARDEKLTLVLDDTGLSYQKDKRSAVVPYERVRHAEILSSERVKGGFYDAPPGAGAEVAMISNLLIANKKRKTDMLVVDFVNERGGRMGLVLQLPRGQGVACGGWLARHGVAVGPSGSPTPSTERP
jgi:hypothetical protein